MSDEGQALLGRANRSSCQAVRYLGGRYAVSEQHCYAVTACWWQRVGLPFGRSAPCGEPNPFSSGSRQIDDFDASTESESVQFSVAIDNPSLSWTEVRQDQPHNGQQKTDAPLPMEPPEVNNPSNQAGRPVRLKISTIKYYLRIRIILGRHVLPVYQSLKLVAYCHAPMYAKYFAISPTRI